MVFTVIVDLKATMQFWIYTPIYSSFEWFS